jgi:hypothetical protein
VKQQAQQLQAQNVLVYKALPLENHSQCTDAAAQRCRCHALFDHGAAAAVAVCCSA